MPPLLSEDVQSQQNTATRPYSYQGSEMASAPTTRRLDTTHSVICGKMRLTADGLLLSPSACKTIEYDFDYDKEHEKVKTSKRRSSLEDIMMAELGPDPRQDWARQSPYQIPQTTMDFNKC